MRILHVISGLNRGGAEYCLKRLVENIDSGRFSSSVISILPLGPVADEIKNADVSIESLNCSNVLQMPRAVWHLAKSIRRIKPDVIQTWLYHADALGTIASFALPRCRLAWNLRNSDLSEEKRVAWRVLTSFLARMSRVPNCIIANSVAGIEAHKASGYRPRQWVHIPNGWNVADGRIEAGSRRDLRASFRLPADDVLIGLVARLARQKDFDCFLSAVNQLQDQCLNLKFVLVGDKLTRETAEFARHLVNNGVRNRLIFLGEQANLERLLPAFDAVTLTSAYGEGMPSIIGEAMAAGLPVIATDVGDVSRLVFDENSRVAPKSPKALADKWIAFANLNSDERAALGERNRSWIAARYSIKNMVTQYENLYTSLVQPQHIQASEKDLRGAVVRAVPDKW